MSELLIYLQTNFPQFRTNRLPALYSDFRILSTTNPDGYTANLSAWTSGLRLAARAGATPSHDLLSLSINDALLRSLETKWGRPLALGAVVREALERREWFLYADFVNREESVYARRGWIGGVRVPGVGEVVVWGLKAMGVIGEGGGAQDRPFVGKVVLLANLEEAASEVSHRAESLTSRTDRIFSKSAFTSTFADVLGQEHKLSTTDTELLLRFLARDRGIIAYDGETIKFLTPSDKSPTITTQETTISTLKTLISDLELQTTILTRRVDELTLTAKSAVERKNRPAALAALKSKKLAETALSKRHATLSQLEEVFASIEQAASQVELVQVMEASSRVLQGLNKEVGGVEKVDDILDTLREEMGKVSEVGDIIAESGTIAVPIDEGEVDDELEAMEKEERVKREQAERKVREEKEKKEAEETKRKLDELAAVERKTREKVSHTEARAEASKETELDGELKRLSLDPKGKEEEGQMATV